MTAEDVQDCKFCDEYGPRNHDRHPRLKADPWAGIGAPEPQSLTRDDLVLAAAKADHQDAFDQGVEYGTWDGLPALVRHDYVHSAAVVLDSAYPLVESAEEIEALLQGTVIVSEVGTVYRRALAGGFGQAHGSTVGTNLVWEQPGAGTSSGRLHKRQSSVELASSGRVWTVVFRQRADGNSGETRGAS